MALIKCPECTKEISDQAQSCPNCAYPIQDKKCKNTVQIKIPNFLMGNVIILETHTGKELWAGKGGQIAEFEISGETEIGFKGRMVKAKIRPNKKYTMGQTGFFGINFLLTEVDTFL